MADADADLQLIGDAAQAAGRAVMGFFRRGMRVWEKGGGSPVSEADLAADAILRERLQGERPDYGWLSEETADDQSRLTAARSFVVDPIDGTRAFVKGRPEFVISVAVVEAGRPIAAAIYNPHDEALYSARAGGGAFRGTQRLKVTQATGLDGARLLGDPGRLTALRDLGASATTVNSAALRLALIAAGEHDALVCVRDKWDWDIAAGHLLIEEAGGVITARTGSTLRYDQPVARQRAPLAAGPALHALLLERLI